MRGRPLGALAAVGAVALSALVPWAAAQPDTPRPTLGRTVVISSVAGKVLVRPKGMAAFQLLRAPRAVPVGSTIDARRGTVKLVTATSTAGKLQSGDFDSGAFTVRQGGATLTDLALVGGLARSRVCGVSAAATHARSASLPTGVLRALHGRAHGQFRTEGRYSAATVRGTEWTTEDRCVGTFISSQRGVVTTTTGGLRQDLDPGESLIAYCFPPSSQLVLRDYCLFVLSRPALGAFGFGLSTLRNLSTYTLCIHAPSGMDYCHQFTLMPPNKRGVRISSVACDQPEGPGSYSARWLVGGRQLGLALPFVATIPQPTPTPMCLG